LDKFGTIAIGKRADLILLEENPLEDVANANERAGVMLRGQWLAEAQLREMLDELAGSYE
jgi:imidazolonepropionase-like amidohydrolase